MEKSFPATVENADRFATEVYRSLAAKGFNKKLLEEYRLLMEEIAVKLTNAAPAGAQLQFRIISRFGTPTVKITCPGKAITLGAEDESDFGGAILEEYGDYLQQSYSGNVNRISFSPVAHAGSFLINFGILLVSALVALCLRRFCSETFISALQEDFLYPVVSSFLQILQAMAMPVAFFSLAAFVIKIQRTLDLDHRLMRLFSRYFITSFVATGTGIFCARIYDKLGLCENLIAEKAAREDILGSTWGEILRQSVPGNILEPWLAKSPIPLLLLAILVGLGASRLFGKEGEGARKAIRICDRLFCRMMGLVYDVIPLFLFFSLLYLWLEYDLSYFTVLIKNLLFLVIPILIILLLYCLQLAFHHINPFTFLREYKDALWENLKIGSNIQAYPYNKRLLARKTKLPRDFLSVGLRLGALMNMDGSCAAVSATIFVLTAAAGINLFPLHMVSVFVVLILATMGSPNQPGTLMLCIVLLMSFVGISESYLLQLLVLEAILGKLYSFVNSVGDIVSMLSEGKIAEKKEV